VRYDEIMDVEIYGWDGERCMGSGSENSETLGTGSCLKRGRPKFNPD